MHHNEIRDAVLYAMIAVVQGRSADWSNDGERLDSMLFGFKVLWTAVMLPEMVKFYRVGPHDWNADRSMRHAIVLSSVPQIPAQTLADGAQMFLFDRDWDAPRLYPRGGCGYNRGDDGLVRPLLCSDRSRYWGNAWLDDLIQSTLRRLLG